MSLKLELNVGKPLTRLWGVVRKFGIGHLLLLSFGLHMFVMASTPDSFVFDEVYYVTAARASLNLQAANIEHMPLAKLMIAGSIRVFGDWWFAWRLPIVLCAIGCLYVFYLLSKRFMSERYALLSTAFLAFDTMFFIHGSIFVLDIPSIFFGVLGLELYFSRKYKWSSAALGVSFLMKEIGLFFMFIVVIYHFTRNFRITRKMVTAAQDQEIISETSKEVLGTHPKTVEKKIWRVRGLTKRTSVTLFVAVFVFLLVAGGGLWAYDAAYKPGVDPLLILSVRVNILQNQDGTVINTTTVTDTATLYSYLSNPIAHLQWSWHYFETLVPAVQTSDENYRPPWSWILPFGNIWNSPHYLTVAVSAGSNSHTTLDWIAQTNPLIAYGFIPLFALAFFDFIRRKGKDIDYLYVIWAAVTWIPWLIVGLFFQRMTFNYYVLYTMPAICMSIGWAYSRLLPRIGNKYARYGLVTLHMVAVGVFFLYFFPLVLFR